MLDDLYLKWCAGEELAAQLQTCEVCTRTDAGGLIRSLFLKAKNVQLMSHYGQSGINRRIPIEMELIVQFIAILKKLSCYAI